MSAVINNVTCFNCILGRKEKKNDFVDKEKSNHKKRKIDFPLEQGMDNDDDDDDVVQQQ